MTKLDSIMFEAFCAKICPPQSWSPWRYSHLKIVHYVDKESEHDLSTAQKWMYAQRKKGITCMEIIVRVLDYHDTCMPNKNLSKWGFEQCKDLKNKDKNFFFYVSSVISLLKNNKTTLKWTNEYVDVIYHISHTKCVLFVS